MRNPVAAQQPGYTQSKPLDFGGRQNREVLIGVYSRSESVAFRESKADYIAGFIASEA
jgi:hypothetical protein